jgi:mRNA interferase HigB
MDPQHPCTEITGTLLLDEFARLHASAKSPIESWRKKTEAAIWKTPIDVRRTFNSADSVKVRSGATVVVFNIGGNNFRIIASVRYKLQKVIVLRVYTHEEYAKNHWINEL